MSLINRIIRKIEYTLAIRNSDSYIKYLRRLGLSIGDGCNFQDPQNTTVDVTRPVLVSIGNDCIFLKNFTLLTHDNVTKVFGILYNDFLPSSGPVTIGNNVYFARNCTVLKGVTIGDNCIVGYGSVVTRNIPSGSVVAGAPAKVICSVDDYYIKRKKQSVEEAFKLAQIIYLKTGKRPTVEQMFEEFPLWMDGDQEDSRLRFSVKYQTNKFHKKWVEEHKAIFSSFDEFIDQALKELDV